MKTLKVTILSVVTAFFMLFSTNASANFVSNSTVGAGGYDLVSYQTGKKPLPGNGNYLATIDNVNYIFANEENLNIFKANQDKYLPQYGGYCAFGASVGKKFIGDPNVYELVDGKLYFNLDNGIKTLWVKDIPGNIVKADKNWKKIKHVRADKL